MYGTYLPQSYWYMYRLSLVDAVKVMEYNKVHIDVSLPYIVFITMPIVDGQMIVRV